jgi:hypothetical protein
MRVLVAAMLLLGLSSVAEAGRRDPGWGVYCRRGFGGAVGVLSAPNSWERLGKSPVFPTVGLVLDGACALDVGAVETALTGDLTAFYKHYDRNKSIAYGGLSANLAVTGGSDEWRFGGHLTGAPWPVGAGLTGDWLPGKARRGQRDGLEARLTMYWPVQPNFQLMLLYVVAYRRIP